MMDLPFLFYKDGFVGWNKKLKTVSEMEPYDGYIGEADACMIHYKGMRRRSE